MPSAGLTKLAGPQRSLPRALRLWTGAFATLIALGLAVLASRPPVEHPYSFDVMNLAEHDAVRASHLKGADPLAPESAAGFALRPALEPNAAGGNAGGRLTRSAAFQPPVPVTGR